MKVFVKIGVLSIMGVLTSPFAFAAGWEEWAPQGDQQERAGNDRMMREGRDEASGDYRQRIQRNRNKLAQRLGAEQAFNFEEIDGEEPIDLEEQRRIEEEIATLKLIQQLQEQEDAEETPEERATRELIERIQRGEED